MTEPVILVDVAPTPQDHIRSLRASQRGVLLRIRIIGMVLILATFAVLVLGPEILWLLALFLGVAGVGLVARSFLLPSAIVRRLPASAFAPRRLEIDGDGIRISQVRSTAWAEVGLGWDAFSSATRHRHVWLLRHKEGGPPTNISRRHLTADQEERLAALLRERHLLAA